MSESKYQKSYSFKDVNGVLPRNLSEALNAWVEYVSLEISGMGDDIVTILVYDELLPGVVGDYPAIPNNCFVHPNYPNLLVRNLHTMEISKVVAERLVNLHEAFHRKYIQDFSRLIRE